MNHLTSSVDDLDPATPDQPAPLDVARVLPGPHSTRSINSPAVTPWRSRRPRPPGGCCRCRRSKPPCDVAAGNDASNHAGTEIQTALRAEQLAAPDLIADAMGATVTTLVAVIGELNTQITGLEAKLADHFEQHPDAKIIRSLPGLGMTLGARVLAEFGDAPNRYLDAKSRKNYSGMSPITRASRKRASSRLSKRQLLSSSSLRRPLKLSIEAFCEGEPGSMKMLSVSLKRHPQRFRPHSVAPTVGRRPRTEPSTSRPGESVDDCGLAVG